jgi:beta-lactamase class C
MTGKATFWGILLAGAAALAGTAQWVNAAATGPQTAQVGGITKRIGEWWNGSSNGTRVDYREFDARIAGYGTTSLTGGEPVNTRTVFRWASLSKGVAATMVGELAAEGRLSLDAPIADYATTLKLPMGNETRATVDDLLSHRLGVTRNAFDRKLEAGADPRTLRPMLATLAPLCQPGQCHAYQNVAFDAASEIVTNITGRPYRQVVGQRLFAPLGMNDASISRAGLIASKSWARPHVGRRTVDVNDNYYRVPAAGGVNSSILDLARWMQAQMGAAPNVIPERVLDRIHAPRVDTNRRRGMFNQAMGSSQYALGWRDYNYRGHRLIGHQGAVMGYRATVLFDPERQSGVALLWNSQSGRPVGIQLELLDRLYGFQRQDWLGLDKAAVADESEETAR